MDSFGIKRTHRMPGQNGKKKNIDKNPFFSIEVNVSLMQIGLIGFKKKIKTTTYFWKEKKFRIDLRF